ncbi:DNA-binding transcriptional LysR family regulator [Luteibacter sp. Sphag1AF]|uniref:LysR substrate-binding domain-containing protein n=1 Tax=Luteibacter sp. Sphag1AF TaxID=2587031 RepID=UPI00160E4F87|nr:LysR substrate-binding domain-containing protein [Luteibacter sp. Sphag1AF]MBB3229030.1 DNA-binding transcriptional LysR family regulator [Luteibacter sp. Sphag1AF]
MSIELRHLRYFIAVADELHFSRAAERLGMSQPPLSQQIRDLERMLGVRLLRRTNRRVELTAAGSVYLEAARDIVARMEQATDLARRAERGEVGELRVAFTRSTPLTAMIPQAIRAFRQAFPAVHLVLEERNTLQQVEALLDGRQEVGILRPTELPDTLLSEPLFADPLVVVIRADHSLLADATRTSLNMADLAGEAFVVFASAAGTGIRRQVLAMCRHAGFAPQISQEAGEASTIIGLVAAGLGVALLPSSLRHIHVEGVRFVPIASSDAASDVQVVRRRDDASPLVHQFIRLLLAERS